MPLLRLLGLPVYLPSALMAVGQMALLVVLPLYVLDLGDGTAVAALVFTMRGLGSVVVNVPASFFIERYGHRTSMAAANGMMALAALVIALSGSSLVVAGGTLLFGAGMGAWLLSRLAFITLLVPNVRRGTALSGLAGLQRMGLLVGPLLGGFGVGAVGYRAVFLAIAATALMTALIIWVSIPTSVPTREASEGLEFASESSHELTDRAAWPSGMLALVPTILRRHRDIFLSAGLFVFSLQMLREQRRLLVVLWGTSLGLEVDDLGLIVSLAAAVDMAMFPVAGFVMDHWGRKAAGGSCIGVLSVAMGLLPFTETATAFALVVLLAGLGNGLGSGIILTMGSDVAPRRGTSQFLGVWRMVGDVGALTGPLLTSVVASLTVALGLSSVIGLAGGVVLWLFVDETLSVTVDTHQGSERESRDAR